jgi:hypothetical protein
VPVPSSWAPDVSAASRLDSAEPGRLFTSFTWGEYAIWHWGPRLKVAVDGRRETTYTDATMSQYREVLSMTSSGLTILDAWDPAYVWLPASYGNLKERLAEHGYRIDHDSPASFIAVRSDLPALESAASVSACFPG